MGELLDDYTASAKECAGQMEYSRDNPDKQPLLGFSIEGSEIPNTRKGMVITRSIARKVTLTASPCNSMCIAEIYKAPEQKSQVADDFDSIFKSTEEAISLFKSGEGEKIYENYLAKKEAESPTAGGKPPKNPYSEYDDRGVHMGTSKSGKKVASHGHIGPYSFNPAEHQEANEHHEHANVAAKNPKLGDNKPTRVQNNAVANASNGRAENRAALSLKDKDKIALEQSKQQMAKKESLCKKHKQIKKDSSTPDMSAPPGEPNQANAQAMQAGALSGPTSFSDAMSNLKNGIMGKKEKKLCNIHKSEKGAWSQGKPSADTVHFHHPEHGTVSVQKQPSGEFHVKHNGKMAGVGGVKGSFKDPNLAGQHAKKYMSAVSNNKIVVPGMYKEPVIKKAIEAGSYNAAPSTLTNGAAYQTESLGSKSASTGAEEHKFQGTKKKDWNRRAKDDYDHWSQKERFEKFMAARMPHLAVGEIRAIGRSLALKKSIDMEKSLKNLIMSKSEKTGIAKELDEKSLKQIQKETAQKWSDRAEEAYKRAIEEKSIKWLMDAIEYGHEAIEHSSLGEDLEVFEKVRAKLMPLHEEATKLLVPESK